MSAKKKLTVMLISDPTKSGMTLSIPKWVRFPLMVLPVFLILAALYGYSYIADLERQLAETQLEAKSNAYTIVNKDAEIDGLKATDAKRYDQLESLAEMTVKLKTQLSELEAYKAIIDDKLGTTEKTTDTQPTRSAGRVTKASETTVSERNFTTSALADDPFDMAFVGGQEATLDDFAAEVDRLLEDIGATMTQIDEEKASYAERDEQVDEILPYWNAYPGVLPLDKDTYVTSPYGYRRNPFGRGYEFHSGVDFKAYYEDIWATGAGVVTYAGYNNGYGYLVVVDHGYGLVTKYAHNSKILVEEGDSVKRYDVIAKSGNSGRSSGPHLHYEILENGETQNPLNYIYEGDK